MALVKIPDDITWVGTPNFWQGRGNEKVHAIVMHIMEGGLEGADSWFGNPRSQVSSHFGIGCHGELHQYVSSWDTAWANGPVAKPDPTLDWVVPGINPNLRTVSIEHSGFSNTRITEDQVQTTLDLCAYLVARYGIPIDRQHIVGHYQIDSVTRAKCPGPNFPWDRIIGGLRHREQLGELKALTAPDKIDGRAKKG